MSGSHSTPRLPALPQSKSPLRTISEPPASPASSGLSPTDTRASQSTVDTQSSAGWSGKTLQLDSQSSSLTRHGSEGLQSSRRHTHDPAKINGYTTCGRHGDDWLFGGFSVAGTVKKLWEKDGKE
ncbi:uncharacterized protein RSE6_06176 [Rhynchosporium secalis]|uniref:Uncharacterized protein n=1 Tax=Rhynchosporium secalis TaxID=38038 RepID=A0A1E1M9N7_RHYSE|nr:uncharacterized protein RSE6_06176 [Rhynchosporium secalis]